MAKLLPINLEEEEKGEEEEEEEERREMLVVSFSPLPLFFPAADIVSRCHPFKGLRGEGRGRTKGGLCSSRFSVFLPAPCGMGFDQYSSLFGTKDELLNQLQLYSSQLWTTVTVGESLPWTVWSPHHLTIGGKGRNRRRGASS